MSKRILLIFSTACLLLTTSASFAATYYVSTGGNDNNSGTEPSSPWRTVSYAQAHATSPGDNIYLKRGDVFTVSGNPGLPISHGGSNGNYITWDGGQWGSGDYARIQQTGNNLNFGYLVQIAGAQYLKFKNIIVDGNGKELTGLAIGGGMGLKQNKERFITIENVKVLNSGRYAAWQHGLEIRTWNNNMSDITLEGVTIDGSADEGLAVYPGRTDIGATPAEIKNLTIRNCVIRNYGRRGSPQGYGLQINNKVTNALIEYNTITNGSEGNGSGVVIESNEPNGAYYPTNITFRYNVIRDIGKWGFFIQNGSPMTVDIYGNVIHNTGSKDPNGGDIMIAGGNYSGAQLRIYNNTIYSSKGCAGLYINGGVSGSPNFELKNNIIYSKNYPCVQNDSGISIKGSNNILYRESGAGDTVVSDHGTYNRQNLTNWDISSISQDPLFLNKSDLPTSINSTNGVDREGLKIQAGSIAKNNGAELGPKYEGSIGSVLRPSEGGWDIGAYELGSLNETRSPAIPSNLAVAEM